LVTFFLEIMNLEKLKTKRDASFYKDKRRCERSVARWEISGAVSIQGCQLGLREAKKHT
jgi:hypothetical protein